ncbi:MAG: alpha/beta fold hydrolase [Thermoleophilia bacterium]|nr:alpha/beta fold hydrolase [Thermoleophilia bacterium]
MLAAIGFSATAEAGKKPTKGPSGDKFYFPSNKKISKKHGTLIWQRKAQKGVRLSSARVNKVIAYSSKSTTGKKVAVTGSLAIPKGKTPKGGWPVVTYAHGTTGIADICAPSRNAPNGPANDSIVYVDSGLNTLVEEGYAVLRTDYEGLGTRGIHPYLIGKSEGRSVLDIVRAARDYKKGLVSKKFVIVGHSQGGHAALFAAGLAKNWVSDLKPRGTIAYAPASHTAEQVPLLPSLTSPSSLTALASLIVRGATTADSAIDPNALLSDGVLAFYPDTKTECLGALAEPDSLGGIAPSTLIRSGADQKPLLDTLAANNPNVVTPQPIFMAQGTADTTVFPFLTNQLNDELVASGDDVDYKLYPGATHGSVVEEAEADSLTFLNARLPSSR